MKSLFFKLQLISGIPFGLIIGIIFMRKGEISDVIFNSILSSLVFGTAASCILISLHKSLCRKIVPDASIHDFNMYQKRSIELDIPFEQAFSLCIQSLEIIQKCCILSQSLDNGEIKARAGLNWKTWGDTIDFKLTRAKDSIVIEISSRPTAGSTLVDFGKNLENVERITRFLRGHT